MGRKTSWIDLWAAVTSVAVIVGFIFTCLLIWSLTAHGQGLAASQPATQPAKALKATKAAPAKAVSANAALAHAALLAPAKVAPASAPAKAVVVPASAPAASQPAVVAVVPASQPAPVASWRTWLRDNWRYLLFVVILPSIITALKRKGVRDGVIGFLEAIIERASVTQPHNSFGTLKWPGQAAGPPVEPPKPPAPSEPPKA